MVAFSFLPQIMGRWWGPTSGTLSFYECRLSGGDSENLLPPANKVAER